ncbi:hypothetical protein CASFOL_001482 [Castilleja foliolosa]|uniref:NmrA-like domain-containing protein n=1 Tax=Castilleja foliolosa TaxID=1961234 RepID=A0ABD3EKM3_9LAMI
MKTVCVTGASGYIASWLVKFLIQRGYTVKASVRDIDDENKTQHLLTFDGAKERLQLINADLLEEGSFDAVIDGCDGVFHTASPFLLSTSDPQAAIIINGKPRTPQVVVDETWWSDSKFCRKIQTLVEDAAWKFVKEKGLDMVAINPDMISLEDCDLFFEYAGAETYPNDAVGWVNVKLVCLHQNRMKDILSKLGRWLLSR